ncbi:hypothetical protein WMF04_46070 [Sorangium sp. So ce260]|uniref:hypothetical protein n=1 Tax=Sorangium sp. So ce260 TaxID=3133291 RepID=UPI003F638E66
MGVHVILGIDPRGIDEAEWAVTHEETLTLLSAWQPRLLGWGWRTIDGVRVPMYTRSLRRDIDDSKQAHWAVAGDRDSLQTAECQSLYRDLGRYAARRGPCPDERAMRELGELAEKMRAGGG